MYATPHVHNPALVIAKQLPRWGTSVAANHRESKHSRSKADRVAKFQIMLQELAETALWLALLIEHEITQPERLEPLLDETNQLIAIFVASAKTSQADQRNG